MCMTGPRNLLNGWTKMTAITNLIIVLMPVIIMGLAIIVKDGF